MNIIIISHFDIIEMFAEMYLRNRRFKIVNDDANFYYIV